MWGALGDLQFSLLGGPIDFSDKQEAEFAEHPMIGGKARLQLTGLKLEEIDLKIRLHPLLTSNPELDLRSLLDSMRQGDPQELVLGRGDSGIYAGLFVIVSVDHQRIEQWPDGRIRLAEVSLKLKEWVKPSELQISARKQPPAAVKTKGKAAPPSTQWKTETNSQGYSQRVPGKP